MKPTFLILGAGKAGTTSLYHYLWQHPDVCMSEPKEPIFFEAEYEKGLEYYWKRYFSHWQDEPAVGEARTKNLYLPYVPGRIKQTLPEAKLIVLVRNPVDRAYAHWWTAYGANPSVSFEEALARDFRDIKSGLVFEGEQGPCLYKEGLLPNGNQKSRKTIVDSGYYASQIQRYRDLFPDSQIRILFFEDLYRNPRELVTEVCEFVDVDPAKCPIDTNQYNVAAPAHSWLSARFSKFPLKDHVSPSWRKAIKRFLGKKRPSMNPETRRMLVEHYYEHNRRLEKLTGRDLSHWDR